MKHRSVWNLFVLYQNPMYKQEILIMFHAKTKREIINRLKLALLEWRGEKKQTTKKWEWEQYVCACLKTKITTTTAKHKKKNLFLYHFNVHSLYWQPEMFACFVTLPEWTSLHVPPFFSSLSSSSVSVKCTQIVW